MGEKQKICNKLVTFYNSGSYRLLISVLFGLLSFFGAFYCISLQFYKYELDVVWNFVFPILVTLAWGWEYGLISLFLGLIGFYPFFMENYNIWGYFGICLLSTIWIVLHGYSARMREYKNRIFYNVYLINTIYSVAFILFSIVIFPLISVLDLPFWMFDGIETNDKTIIIIIMIKTIINAFMIIAISDVLMLLPFVRKIFVLKVDKTSRYNSQIVMFALVLGGLFMASSIFANRYIMSKFSIHVYENSNEKVVLSFFAHMTFFALAGGIVAKSFQNRLKSQQVLKESEAKYKILYEKMMNGFAIIETVSDKNGNTINYHCVDMNPAAENFCSCGKRLTDHKRCEEISENAMLEKLCKDTLEKGTFSNYEHYNPNTGMYYLCNAFKVTYNQVGIVFENITPYKKVLEEIQKLNEVLEQRVSERTRELQNVVEELEAFTYTASHDLKSPLRAIDGYARFIIEDYQEDISPEVKEMINNIRNVCSDMIALIGTLLDYSTTSKTDICREKVDVKDMVLLVFENLKPLYPQRQIELKIESELPNIFVDTVLFKQVVYNTLSNAVKFTKDREKAIINVGCFTNKKEYIFYVKDNGVGFDMEFSQKLFGIFQRLHSAEDFEGNGLGLATIRKIIQKHGGRTWIEGKVDKGTAIYFTLPVMDK